MRHTIDVESRRNPYHFPAAVYDLLDFFDEAEPTDVVVYHHAVGEALGDGTEESRERYQFFNKALEVYPEDNQATPGAAIELYQTFANSGEVVDRQVVSGHLDRLWEYAPESALALTRQLWPDPNRLVHTNVRLAAKWALNQGILDKTTWRELRRVIPLARWAGKIRHN